jgi:hypothetical protein
MKSMRETSYSQDSMFGQFRHDIFFSADRTIYFPFLGKYDIQAVKKVPGPLLSPGALDFMPISPSRVIRENHTRQTIIKNSRGDNHKMK